MPSSHPQNPDRHRRHRFHSFADAFRGIRVLMATQANARLHACAALCTLLAGWWLQIESGEWIVVILCISLVFAAETINTSLEFLSDRVTTLHDPLIGHAKDLAAAAVLFASMGAAAVGVIVFVPKLLALIS